MRSFLSGPCGPPALAIKALAEAEEIIILKAFDGDRAKNLDAIAAEFKKHFEVVSLDVKEKRRFLGYCEQLGIIADELKESK